MNRLSLHRAVNWWTTTCAVVISMILNYSISFANENINNCSLLA